jgi:hypothetical protein
MKFFFAGLILITVSALANNKNNPATFQECLNLVVPCGYNFEYEIAYSPEVPNTCSIVKNNERGSVFFENTEFSVQVKFDHINGTCQMWHLNKSNSNMKWEKILL